MSVLLFLAERSFGLSSDVRSMGGAGLVILGIFFLWGGGGGYRRARAVDTHDVRLLRHDRQSRIGAGGSLLVIGVVVFISAVLMP